MTKRIKRLEKDISRIKYSLELVRTVVPVIVLFMQVLDYYTYWEHAEFLKHEKYLLSLTALVGDGLYQIFIKPRLSVK